MCIRDREGTKISFEKESFEDLEGNPIEGEIEINLTEVMKTKDMVLQKISTNTVDGRILETAGMIHLEATSNGKILKLKEGKEFTVEIPNRKKMDGMNLFYGVPNTEGIMEWEEAKPMEKKAPKKKFYTSISNKPFPIPPTFGGYINNPNLTLKNGVIVNEMAEQYFNFQSQDLKELLFKKVEAIYILHDDGDMDFLEFRGSRISENLKNKIISKIVSFPECKPYLRNNSPIHIEGIFTFMVDTIPFEKTVSVEIENLQNYTCLLYTSPSPRDATLSRMPSSA